MGVVISLLNYGGGKASSYAYRDGIAIGFVAESMAERRLKKLQLLYCMGFNAMGNAFPVSRMNTRVEIRPVP